MEFNSFEELLALVKGKSSRVVVPGANNDEALEAIRMADENGLISEGVLVGDSSLVESMARAHGLNLKKFSFVHKTEVPDICNTAVALIKEGRGDFLVKGLVDTKFYMKAILNKEMGFVKPGALLSHVVLFKAARYKKFFAVADAAINISPSLEQKAQIVQNTVDTLRRLGVEKPKVSIVCPIEKLNEKVPSTMDAAALVQMSRDGRIKNAVVEGPYDMYISLSRTLAEEKGVKGGEVPGDADALIMPNLEAANPLYKALLFFGEGVQAAGVITGTSVPAILPSRSDAPLVKLNSIALASYLRSRASA